MLEKEAHFSIDGLILFQLGESLITNVVQALVELVKNSYDADATYAKITMNTSADNSDVPGHSFVMVEDDGIGMNEQTIRDGWLTIASSLKRDQKEQGGLTRRGRTPLGDKGLGRLGTQRLGANLEIQTRPKGEQVEYHVPIAWDRFRSVKDLSTVRIPITVAPSEAPHGTRIMITDLCEIEQWTDKAVMSLERELSSMISPYEEIREFTVVATFNGARLNLADVPDRVRDVAQGRYRFEFDGTSFRMSGRLRLDVLRPGEKDTSAMETYRQILELDDGRRFIDYLSNIKVENPYSFRLAKDAWSVEFDGFLTFDDLGGVQTEAGTIANPGPFRGEVDSFNLSSLDEEAGSVFDRLADFRKYVRSLAGIRVYRDGFGIQVSDDWLGLSGQWTGGGSWYTLRPNSTLGYVALSARDNAALEETTDREGFKDNAYYRNFYELLRRFVKFTADAQETIRRGWLSFAEQHRREAAEVEESASPEVVLRRIGTALDESGQYKKPLHAMLQQLVSAEEGSRKTSEFLTKSMESDPKARAGIAPHLGRLEAVIQEAKDVIGQVQDYLQRLDQAAHMTDLVQDQLKVIRDQLDMTYETMSLGLTTEILSHEIRNIANQLADRTRNVRNYLRSRDITDSRLLTYLDLVGSTVSALRKELSHLTPSLRYVRERRERIRISDFLADSADYHNRRMKDRKVKVNLISEPTNDFLILANRGKVTQIMDNLVLNSQYWLQEDIRLSKIRTGLVSIEIDRPCVRIWDNGRGIAPAVEDTLFDPFITTKPTGQGRGLGLFIVRQLLDSENCTIRLLPDRNANGRLHIFEIDLAGGLITGE